jgi:hypothetical protein
MRHRTTFCFAREGFRRMSGSGILRQDLAQPPNVAATPLAATDVIIVLPRLL